MGTSIFFMQAPILRAGAFIFTIIFLILTNVVKKFGDRELSLQGSSIKVFFTYLIIIFLTGNKEVMLQISLPFGISYIEFESLMIMLVFLFSIIMNHFQFNLITKYGLVGYQVFIYGVIRGFWLIGLGIYFLIGMNILKSSIIESTSIIWEEYLLISLFAYLGVSFLPYSYNSLKGSVTKRNSLINFRDSAFGASVALIFLDFFFKQLTFDVWNTLLPLLFLSSLILLVMKDQDTSYEEKFIAKSLQKTKEMAKKLSSFDFEEPENAFLTEKTIDVFKKHSSKLSASKNSVIIPLSSTEDFVAIEVIGDLALEVKDNLGRIKKETTKKATLMLTKTEWQSLTKKMKAKKLVDIKLPQISSKDDFLNNLEDSLSVYKNKFQSMGLTKVEDNLKLMKRKYSIDVGTKNHTEFNFPGIKVIEEPGSQLFNIGPIKAIDIKRKMDDGTPAKYFSLKMPFVSATELDLGGKFFILNMPFVSALETPKGLMLKIFGFDVTEGNKQEILGDLDRILKIQAKFNDYFNYRMTNVLATDDNPNLILTKGEMDEPKLLVAGSEDSVFIDEMSTEISKDSSEVLELSNGEYEIIEDANIDISVFDEGNLDLKLKKLMKRIDSLSKEEFIEYMGFQSNRQFLDWLTELPEDSSIRVEENVVYFR
ncbi:MAG: hypothetical protein KAT16_04250, partial [Candidatus Heimdallarchaeota archaeon]|nr:hypothetical protein [Candidatus Heimdallarchaeota archaeon]